MSAEKSAGVRDGVEALAFGTTKTPPQIFAVSEIPGGSVHYTIHRSSGFA
jgi:hypothetical protein